MKTKCKPGYHRIGESCVRLVKGSLSDKVLERIISEGRTCFEDYFIDMSKYDHIAVLEDITVDLLFHSPAHNAKLNLHAYISDDGEILESTLEF